MPFAKIRGGVPMTDAKKYEFETKMGLSPYEIRVAEILDKKLLDKDIDPSDDNLTDEQISEIEELTKDAQDEAKKEFGQVE